MRQVGFQGLRGAYSEMAILKYFPEIDTQTKPLSSFDAVFTALTEGRLSDALLPFENSLAGMIHENYDHLARFPVVIRGECILEVQHCLLQVEGQKLEEIRTIISHPQALVQCSEYIAKQGWVAQTHFDTAGAAAFLAKEKPKGYAAIASEQAAALYGLQVTAHHIADRGQNFTRFLHLQRSEGGQEGYEVGSRDGRLLSLLLLQTGAGFGRIGPLCGILQSLGIELVHCEARPTKDKAWSYYYFIELAAGPDHPSWPLAVEMLCSLTRTWKYLGSYHSLR